MLPIIIFFFQRIKDHLHVLFITKKIGIAGINKKCFDIVLLDIVCIRLLETE